MPPLPTSFSLAPRLMPMNNASGFISALRDDEFNPEPIYQYMVHVLDDAMPGQEPTLAMMKAKILRECRALLPSYIHFMSYYTNLTEQDHHEAAIDYFFRQYDAFILGFEDQVKNNIEKRFISSMIALVWIRVIERLDEKARRISDNLTRTISHELKRNMMAVIGSM